jgi:hypothetical protein
MKNQPRVGLVVFAAGLPNWRAAGVRLCRQALNSGRFSKVSLVTDRTLPVDSPQFWQENRSVLSSRVKGFGFWIWKPYVIAEAMRQWSKDVDYVLYLDAGCEINDSVESMPRWLEYIELASTNSGRFAMTISGHPEKDWSKMDTMQMLGLTSDQRESDQVQATPLFAMRPSSAEFCDEWFQICKSENYRFVDDSPSALPNSATFREHRHDQAIFSGLVKKYGVETVADETFWAPNWSSEGLRYPIWAPRNRTRVPTLEKRLVPRCVRFSERAYSRAYRDLQKAWYQN